ncbi:MAG: hybrid sensor histidine kinase/response regulator [Anaerolineae bacterium]|nr:hybrid sensor histidine kinase/response regulator [Anaerolineae bacterium]
MPRVLFVEDDRVDQLAFAKIIQEGLFPFQVVSVETAAAARAALRSDRFDVVVSDYRLGGETAFDILSEAIDIPFVFITGVGSEAVAVRAMKAGVYDYLTKDSQHNYLRVLPTVVSGILTRRRLEAEARESQRDHVRRQVLAELLHEVSHDLRTALTMLGTSLHLCERHFGQLREMLKDAPPEVLGVLQNLVVRRNQVERTREQLESFILNMLAMARLDGAELRRQERRDLNELAAAVFLSYRPILVQRGLEFAFDAAPRPLQVTADVEGVTSILEQLLANAIAYTPAPGAVRMRAYRAAGWVVLEVEDTGIGIAPADRERIFERFFRGENARQVSQGNSGLGLSIARRLVELQGGRIEVDSRLSMGSTFRVILPAATP